MILDEATSSIDTRTERIVQDGMDKLMNGRTVLVIAHRLSTIQNAKAIMVMDHGKIIERGEHDYLIEQKGVDLFYLSEKSQFEKIAIASSGGEAWPCGICRQFMKEFCDDDFVVITGNDADSIRTYTLAELLPEGFRL